ncbi:peptidylprolyl isomerase [Erythrobacter arachoides]|uniref:Peptidylprolyl isomerase n=1 Tax=Aurantiacibacter arachoides TaxID=1850444 RepID=A0A845A1C5_9SPHN|nr:peptidylprolyl isomerase [Aurantiacibacter arachoides]MXO93935.1 peptidylprolyl isomerase [Aurantiacibacter arachoides]GGD45491.1 hypothetical protein GCM10011411_01330 [Aurantiacibacter arachoides]
MKHIVGLALLALTIPAAAQEAQEPATPTSVIAAASAEDWVAIAPADLLIMDLSPDARGNARRVMIQLMPPPFSQPWVANIRTLAAAHWWDGTSVNRVQDNYVTQWGDVTEAKPLPEGVVSPVADYAATGLIAVPDPRGRPRLNYTLGMLMVRNARLAANGDLAVSDEMRQALEGNAQTSPSELSMPEVGDRYAGIATFVAGWPVGGNFSLHGREAEAFWPIHCYGAVGVGRNMAPDTGTGAELYTIIGQPQRHMDRNLAVVGRVIEGMEHLSSLPRGSGDLGFYTEEEADLRVSILSVRLGSELADAPAFEYLDTASESFARYVAVRANRNDAFYTVPAGGVDVCSVQVPVRRAE